MKIKTINFKNSGNKQNFIVQSMMNWSESPFLSKNKKNKNKEEKEQEQLTVFTSRHKSQSFNRLFNSLHLPPLTYKETEKYNKDRNESVRRISSFAGSNTLNITISDEVKPIKNDSKNQIQKIGSKFKILSKNIKLSTTSLIPNDLKNTVVLKVKKESRESNIQIPPKYSQVRSTIDEEKKDATKLNETKTKFENLNQSIKQIQSQNTDAWISNFGKTSINVNKNSDQEYYDDKDNIGIENLQESVIKRRMKESSSQSSKRESGLAIAFNFLDLDNESQTLKILYSKDLCIQPKDISQIIFKYMENAKILSLIFVSELKSPNICVQEEMDRKEMNIEELNLIDETDNTVDSKRAQLDYVIRLKLIGLSSNHIVQIFKSNLKFTAYLQILSIEDVEGELENYAIKNIKCNSLEYIYVISSKNHKQVIKYEQKRNKEIMQCDTQNNSFNNDKENKICSFKISGSKR